MQSYALQWHLIKKLPFISRKTGIQHIKLLINRYCVKAINEPSNTGTNENSIVLTSGSGTTQPGRRRNEQYGQVIHDDLSAIRQNETAASQKLMNAGGVVFYNEQRETWYILKE